MSPRWIFGIALYMHVAPLAIYVSREMQIDRTEPPKPVHVELRASTVPPWRDKCGHRPAICSEQREIEPPECACPRPALARGPRTVPPSRLHRLSGTDVQPSEAVRAQMKADGKVKVVGFYKVCLDRRGEVSHVSSLLPTHYDRYDEAVVSMIWSWRYQPVTDRGRPIDVCTAVSVVVWP